MTSGGLYGRLYNKLVPLPSDEVLSARLRSMLPESKAPTEKAPAVGAACHIHLTSGSLPGIKGGKQQWSQLLLAFRNSRFRGF